MPHQAIVFTNEKNLKDFSLQKVAVAFEMHKDLIGTPAAIWEVEIHPSNSCNLKCKGCAYGTRHNHHQLSPKQVLEIINHYSQYDLKSVFFSGGGEPLLWTGWDFLLDHLEKSCHYGIATNMVGFYSIESFSYIFDFYQIHVIGFDDHSFYAATGTNYFSLCDKNIRRLALKKAPSQNIALKLLVSVENVHLLPLYLDYSSTIDNVDSIIIKFQQDFIRDHNCSTAGAIDAIRKVVYNHAMRNKYNFLIDNLDDIIKNQLPPPSKCVFSDSGQYKLINASGECYPCIAGNAVGYNAQNEHDFYDRAMNEGRCPKSACRHYRFSQFLSNRCSSKYSSNLEEYVPILL